MAFHLNLLAEPTEREDWPHYNFHGNVVHSSPPPIAICPTPNPISNIHPPLLAVFVVACYRVAGYFLTWYPLQLNKALLETNRIELIAMYQACKRKFIFNQYKLNRCKQRKTSWCGNILISIKSTNDKSHLVSGYLCQEHRHREGHEFDRQTITPSRLVYAAAVPPSCLSRGEESRGNLLRIQNFPFPLSLPSALILLSPIWHSIRCSGQFSLPGCCLYVVKLMVDPLPWGRLLLSQSN